ncbi:hypothetical protein HQ531_07900 [bacterium]|nr:hypothetical protein [bacterium]
MKKIKTILISIVLLVALVFGQGEIPELRVRIAATVVDYIEMTTISDIDVGTVIPSEDILRLDPRTDQGAGIIKVHGRENASILVTFSGQVEMVNLAGNTTLTVTYAVSGNQDNDQSGSELFTINPNTITLNNYGEYYMWIGCEFSLLNLVSGQYDGDFAIEVDYN